MDLDDPSPGHLLAGRYRLLDALGSGGMGAVLRGRDETTGREVAVKILHDRSASAQARFRREAETTARLNHPNVVRIHDALHLHGRDVLIYELIEGAHPLDSLWLDLPLPQRLDLLGQAAAGVGAAHTAGVVHRDLKPENIAVRADGRVVVLDFGLARVHESDLTKTGQMLGTPSYMAPEQCNGSATTPATDTWALGVLLYQALYDGTHPFVPPGASVYQVLGKIRRCKPNYPAGPPPALIALLKRCLVFDPTQRLPDANAFRQALAHARGAQASTRRKLHLALAATSLLLLCSVALTLWSPPQPSPPPPTPPPTSDDTPTRHVAQPEPTYPMDFAHAVDSPDGIAALGSVVVVFGGNRVECWSTRPDAQRLRLFQAQHRRSLTTDAGLLLSNERGTFALDAQTLTLTHVDDAYALVHDRARHETLYRTERHLELRAADGRVLQRVAFPPDHTVERAQLLPDWIVYSTQIRNDRDDAPSGGPKTLLLASRTGDPDPHTPTALQGVPLKHSTCLQGRLVLTPGNGILMEVDEDLTALNTFEQDAADATRSSALRVTAHSGEIRGVYGVGERILTFSRPYDFLDSRRDGARDPHELTLWDRTTRRPLQTIRDVPIQVLTVRSDGVLVVCLPRKIVLVRLDDLDALRAYADP